MEKVPYLFFSKLGSVSNSKIKISFQNKHISNTDLTKHTYFCFSNIFNCQNNAYKNKLIKTKENNRGQYDVYKF